MAQRIGLGLAFVVAFAGLGWWLLVKTPAEPQDLITLGAVAFACLAWFQSRRSANAATANAALAQLNEERSKYGWTITLHPNGDHYVLRNIGTLAAHLARRLDQSGEQHRLWDRCAVQRRAAGRRTGPQRHRIRRRRPLGPLQAPLRRYFQTCG
jgi:hypothetical protein